MSVLVFEVHAAGRGLGIGFDLRFAFRRTAPPGFRPAVFDDALEVIIGLRIMDVGVTEVLSLRQDAGLDLIEQITDLRGQVILGEEDLPGLPGMSRRAAMTEFFSTSFGPISRRSGTPRSSHS